MCACIHYYILKFLGNDTVLEMTKDFDVITEFPINVEDLGEGNYNKFLQKKKKIRQIF